MRYYKVKPEHDKNEASYMACKYGEEFSEHIYTASELYTAK